MNGEMHAHTNLALPPKMESGRLDLRAGRMAAKSNRTKHSDAFVHGWYQRDPRKVYIINDDETLSPVAWFESLRLVLALTTLKDWGIHQMDASSAIRNWLLDKEIYGASQVFIDPDHPDKLCLLQKGIYGLSSPR